MSEIPFYLQSVIVNLVILHTGSLLYLTLRVYFSTYQDYNRKPIQMLEDPQCIQGSASCCLASYFYSAICEFAHCVRPDPAYSPVQPHKTTALSALDWTTQLATSRSCRHGRKPLWGLLQATFWASCLIALPTFPVKGLGV